ncbi:MAG: hypothetical protein IPJ82_22165, partial [Lewinellaceae bacterium]|nr:hypothetical protein [Lewinellaceae bacterium]
HHCSTTPTPKSDTLFRKPGEKETVPAFFSAAPPLTWAERLKQAQALTVQKKRLEALTKLVQEALGPGFYVRDKTALLSTDRNNCDYYHARSPDGMNVNFDANEQDEAKTYYCNDGDGKLSAHVVLGMKALHPMSPAYTAMMNQHQQMLAKGMEAKGWLQNKPAPTNSEKLQAYLANFTQFFFDLVSYNLHTCKALIAFKFDGLFVAYPHVTEPEQVAAFKPSRPFTKRRSWGIPAI